MSNDPMERHRGGRTLSGLNHYSIQTPEEMVIAIREQDEKTRILHEQLSKAWHEMNQASGHHEFLVSACREADRECGLFRHRLEELLRREAYRLAEEPSCGTR